MKSPQQYYIYKINSVRFREANWNLKLTLKEAFENDEVVQLADNTVLRFIREYTNKIVEDKKVKDEVRRIKRCINEEKKKETSEETKENIQKYINELNCLLHNEHYIDIVMDNNSDFDRLNEGFTLNGIPFKRLLATTGGGKNSTVVYVSEHVHGMLDKKINNGRDPNKLMVPAKLEAYKALTCTASIPVSMPKGILVVKDCMTTFNADIIRIDDTDESKRYPVMERLKDEKIEMNASDGFGLITPELSKKWAKELGEDYIPSGLLLRGSFCKGMVFTFDIQRFAADVAEEYMVEDAWTKNMVDIRTVDLILTTSMLKLWSSYDDLEHYLKCCEENGYSFSIAKITPKELENERDTNYQFLQSLFLSDDNIDELIKPTVSEIHDVLGMDYRKSILFLKGSKYDAKSFVKNESNFAKALMIDKEMINDPFVRSRIHDMNKKRIEEAKVGVLKLSGNYQIASGDPFLLLQSIFKMPLTGLLGKGEFYSDYWNKKGVSRVACFRAPMSCHNNIRLLNLKNDNKVNVWYQYMNTVLIMNLFDTTTQAQNGEDFDADSNFTTDCPTIINAVEELDAIICVQKTAKVKAVTEKDLIKANKSSFGDTIGSITNKVSSMHDVKANFEKGTHEYEELEKRIMCGQNYQQNAIDKAKGIKSRPMPKEWYDYKSNLIHESDDEETRSIKELNMRILANKKPYFFIYIYPKLKKDYKKFIKDARSNCIRRFNLTPEQLMTLSDKTKEQVSYLESYERRMPVSKSNSIMNKICWRLEREFDGIVERNAEGVEFDYTILKSDSGYSKKNYNEVLKIYQEHNKKLREFSQSVTANKLSKEQKKENKRQRQLLVEQFVQKASAACSNSEELCNIVVDICYKPTRQDVKEGRSCSEKSKQFAWDVCGAEIIHNLLKRNNYTYCYPVKDEEGDIAYGGYKFSLKTETLEVSELE